MKLRILMMLSIGFLSLGAFADTASDAASDTLRDLQRGVRNGYVEDLSYEQQKKFVQLLNDAANLLYKTPSVSDYSCVAQGNGWFAVVNLETNKKLGQNVGTLADCQKVLPKSDRLYACVAEGNGWYAVYDMLRTVKLGENVGTFNDCQKVVPTNEAKFACVNQGNGWYAVFNLKNNVKIGENVGTFNDCQRALPTNVR